MYMRAGALGQVVPGRGRTRSDERIHLNPPTPNLPTNIAPTNIAWLKLSGKSPMGLGISPLKFKIVLESNPLKPTMLVGRLGVLASCLQASGWHYLSDAACLMRPDFFCVFRRVKGSRNSLHYSSLLKKACVRQVVLDTWLFLSLARCCKLSSHKHIYIYIYRERERCVYIYIYIYMRTYYTYYLFVFCHRAAEHIPTCCCHRLLGPSETRLNEPQAVVCVPS